MTGIFDRFVPDLDVIGSTLSGNLQGIVVFQTDLEVTDSTVSDNLYAGVLIDSLLENNAFTDSTISGNGNGGIVASAPHIRIHHSTVSNNQSRPGIEFGTLGSLEIDSSTILDNEAGGIRVADNGSFAYSVAITNSIIAGNGSTTSGDLYGYAFELSYSLVQSPGDVGVLETVPGSNLFGIDPLLGPLTDNGGPTATHLPLPGSPLVDAGDPAFVPPPDNDQRGEGFARVAGGRLDIGAVEVQSAAGLPVGTLSTNHLWTPFCPDNVPANALLFLGPPSFVGWHPGVLRIRPSAGACARQVAFREWDYRARDFGDFVHAKEQAGYLALAPGRYSMPDGSLWEVGRASVRGTRAWRRVAFSSPLPGTPSLFLTPQTANGGSTVALRARDVDADGFRAALFEEEFLNDGHAPEDFAYLAIYHPDADDGLLDDGQAVLAGMPLAYSLARADVDHRWTEVAGVQIKLEEEQSLDDETAHLQETVDVLRIAGQVFVQEITSKGSDTVSPRRR